MKSSAKDFYHLTEYILEFLRPDSGYVKKYLLLTFMFSKTTSPHTALLAIDGETVVVAGYMKAQFSFMKNCNLLDTFVRHPKHWKLDPFQS